MAMLPGKTTASLSLSNNPTTTPGVPLSSLTYTSSSSSSEDEQKKMQHQQEQQQQRLPGRGSRKSKNGQKKIPQRGLGVAQLEKLRMEEQRKQEAACLASLHRAHVLPPLSEYSAAGSFHAPVFCHSNIPPQMKVRVLQQQSQKQPLVPLHRNGSKIADSLMPLPLPLPLPLPMPMVNVNDCLSFKQQQRASMAAGKGIILNHQQQQCAAQECSSNKLVSGSGARYSQTPESSACAMNMNVVGLWPSAAAHVVAVSQDESNYCCMKTSASRRPSGQQDAGDLRLLNSLLTASGPALQLQPSQMMEPPSNQSYRSTTAEPRDKRLWHFWQDREDDDSSEPCNFCFNGSAHKSAAMADHNDPAVSALFRSLEHVKKKTKTPAAYHGHHSLSLLDTSFPLHNANTSATGHRPPAKDCNSTPNYTKDAFLHQNDNETSALLTLGFPSSSETSHTSSGHQPEESRVMEMDVSGPFGPGHSLIQPVDFQRNNQGRSLMYKFFTESASEISEKSCQEINTDQVSVNLDLKLSL